MSVTHCRRVITQKADLGNEMSDEDDLTTMDDPDFLAERRRVREALEHTPERDARCALVDRYWRLNEEFLRRARIAWRGDT
jgi:hypothetical protein